VCNLISASRAPPSLPESPDWLSSFLKNRKQNISRKFQLNFSPSESNFLQLLGSRSVAVRAGNPEMVLAGGLHFGSIHVDIITALVPTASASTVLTV